MISDKAYQTLMANLLPSEIARDFELVDVMESCNGKDKVLHLFLEEKEVSPDPSRGLKPNGFYEESRITDFPIRDTSVTLHVKRRRWKDDDGKSYSREIGLCAEGTRLSNEFALFLKGAIG